MTKINALLSKRLKSGSEENSKMNALAEKSSAGHLTSFSGLFRLTPLSLQEEEKLEELLLNFSNLRNDIAKDLKTLSSITSEVKAINNQAAILHGERIKKVQELLLPYRDGAFSAWLIAAYGNRQTPYNFLQYYEFYHSLPQDLQPKIDTMPRQIIYTLASRKGDLEKKEMIIKSYNGEPKEEILILIRKAFPLPPIDRRRQNLIEQAILSLTKMTAFFNSPSFKPNASEKKQINQLLDNMRGFL